MNKTIEMLIQQKNEQEEKIKQISFELSQISDSLRGELFKETTLLNKVLKHNLIDIIDMIHKRKLLCSSVKNAETMWNDTVYKVSDGCYFANIIAKDGTIKMDLTNIDNDGGGENLYKTVDNLIKFDILPFCETEKANYKK